MKLKKIIAIVFLFTNFYFFSQETIMISELVNNTKKLIEESKTYDIKYEQVLGCRLRFGEIKYSDKLNIRVFLSVSDSKDTNYFVTSKNIALIKQNQIIVLKGFSDELSKTHEIIITDKNNIPLCNYIFLDGKCMLYSIYKENGINIQESTYIMTENILLSEINLLELDLFNYNCLTNFSRFRTDYVDENLMRILYSR